MGLEYNPELAPLTVSGELSGFAQFKTAIQVSILAAELVGRIAHLTHQALRLAPFLMGLELNPELAPLMVSGDPLEVVR